MFYKDKPNATQKAFPENKERPGVFKFTEKNKNNKKPFRKIRKGFYII